MTASHDQFNDDELLSFLDSEVDRELADLQKEHRTAAVRAIVWQAASDLGMDLIVGQDPTAHDDDYEALRLTVSDMLEEIHPQGDEVDTRRASNASIIADRTWDQAVRITEQICQAVANQLYADAAPAELQTQKKLLTALIITAEDSPEYWLPLIDRVLDGEVLDTSKPEDSDIMLSALEMVANTGNRPAERLYSAILTLLGVPEFEENLPEEYELETLKRQTFAARDITEAACIYSGDQQPNRHATINEIAHRYNLDNAIIPILLMATDSFQDELTAE